MRNTLTSAIIRLCKAEVRGSKPPRLHKLAALAFRRRQPHDRDRPRIAAALLFYGEHPIQALHGERVKPITVGALDFVCHEATATLPDLQLALRMGEQVVIPSRVTCTRSTTTPRSAPQG